MKPKRSRLLIGGVIALLLVPVALSALTASALLQMLHMSRTVVADLRGTKTVQIESRDHFTLKAAWSESPSFAGSCVLSVHGVGGWRARSQRFLPWLLPAGYSVLAPDMRAHGESGGDTITFGLLEQYDVLDWAQWMRGQGCTQIYGMGESMGASILIMAAGVVPGTFEALVAESAFADLLEAAEERATKLFPFPAAVAGPLAKLAVAGGSVYVRLAEGLDFHESMPVRSIAKLEIPVLLIHGLEDTRTPASHSRELAAANPKFAQLWLVPGARHVNAYTVVPQEYKERVLGLFGGAR